MEHVFFLLHTRNYNGDIDHKAIGVYASSEAAEQAIGRLRDMPGFCDPRGYFTIHPCVVDHDYYPQGYDDPATGYIPSGADRGTPLCGTTMERLFSVYNMSTRSEVEFDNDYTNIGLYSSLEAATAAIERFKDKVEFAGPSREFGIDRYPINQDSWSEGFVSGEEALKPFR